MGEQPMRLSPVARLDLIEEVVDLSATAIRMRHPDAHALAQVRVGDVAQAADADLLAERERLAAWIAERGQPDGSTAPEVAAG